MVNIAKGIISGLMASAFISGGIYLASALGLGQSFDPLRITTGITLHPPSLGWIMYFVLGALLWGTLFAVLSPVLPGLFWCKGAVFGVVAWLLIVAIAQATEASTISPLGLQPFVAHLALGTLLGFMYGTLLDEGERRLA